MSPQGGPSANREALAQSIPEPVPGTWPPSVEAVGSPSTVASTGEQERKKKTGMYPPVYFDI